jgi:signal transduction histidine kinase
MNNGDSVVAESMHELRYFNQRLKNLSEQLSKELNADEIGKGVPININGTHADQIRVIAEGILSLSQLFTTRFYFIDIELNPSVIESLPVSKENIFGKFDKARRMLNSQARGKKVKVRINKPDLILPYIDAYPLIDILPYLILDNAIKYSPDKSEVGVEFELVKGSLSIKIESIGPHVAPDEIGELTKKGYRGKNAKLGSENGTGIGLHFVKFICDIHDIKLNLKSDKIFCEYDGIPHSMFTVQLTLSIP